MKSRKASIAISISIALLAGCGGGGGGGGTKSFAIAATAGAGGTVTPSTVTATEGSTASFTFTADTGYSLTGVTGCGGTLSGSSYTTGAITSACTLTGTFSLNTYPVAATVGTGGRVDKASALVTHGSSTTFTFTPDAEYVLDQVAGCGGVLNGNAYSTGAVTAECAVSATFSKTTAVQVALKDAISTGLVLQNNGGDDLVIAEPGTFAFSAPVKSGAPYSVTVKTQPDGKLCSVVDAQGNVSLPTSPKVYVSCMNLVQTDDGFVMVSKLATGASALVGGSYKISALSESQATTAQASEQFLYVPSRPDAVHVFRINADGTLVEHVAPYTHPYDGFRPHFRMSADGKVAYFAHQLFAQLVIGLSVDETTGALTQTGTVEMQMGDARTLHLSPSGRTIYVQGSSTSDVCPQWSLTGACLVAEIGVAANAGGQFVQLDGIEKVPGSISPAGGTNFSFRTAYSIAHFGRKSFYYPTVGEIHRYQILPQGGASSEGLSYVDYVQNLSGSLNSQWGTPSISGRLYVDRSGNRLYQVFNGHGANFQQWIPGALLEPQIGIHAIKADGGLGPLAVLSGTSKMSGLCPAGGTPSFTQTWLTPPVEDVRGNFLFTSQTVTTNCVVDGSGSPAPRLEVGIFAYDISGGIENARLIEGSPFYPGKLHPSALFLIRHPTQDWLYAPNQDGGSIDGYRINTTSGALTKMQGSPFGTAKSPGTGESLVKIDATGKFLYLMAPLEVFAFAIDQTTGALSLIGSYPLTVQ